MRMPRTWPFAEDLIEFYYGGLGIYIFHGSWRRSRTNCHDRQALLQHPSGITLSWQGRGELVPIPESLRVVLLKSSRFKCICLRDSLSPAHGSDILARTKLLLLQVRSVTIC